MPRLESAVKDLRPSRDGPIVIDDLRANTGFMGGGVCKVRLQEKGFPSVTLTRLRFQGLQCSRPKPPRSRYTPKLKGTAKALGPFWGGVL